MPDLSACYRINTPSVVSQTIDRESIIIHFDTGMYYSTNPTGAAIWSLIENGATGEGIIECMRCNYAADDRTIADAVARFIEDLQAEQLIVGTDSVPESTTQSPSAPEGDRPAFSDPILQKYADMAELLLLDPVHEIEDRARQDGRNAGR
jgi:hypothetical protein